MNFADLVITGGDVFTQTKSFPRATAVAVRDGRVLAVGSRDEMRELIGPKTKLVDLSGCVVMPGFIDSHVHFVQTGLDAISVDLSGATSVKEVLERLKRQGNTMQGGWIRGVGFDETKCIEKRPPSIDELDGIFPDRPVWLCRVDSHSCVVNTAGLKTLNLPPDTEGIQRKSGRPTGFLSREANSLARKKVFGSIPKEQRLKAMKAAERMALEAGITMLNALEGGPLFADEDAESLFKYRDELTVETVLFYQTTDVKKVLEMGLERIGGCIILDGSFGSRTAALLEPYADDPTTRGVLYFSDEELRDFVLRAHKSGLQITFHALGERAIEQVISAYEHAQSVFPRKDARHRVEHFELPTPEHYRRAAAAGVVLSVQPAFEHFWGGVDGMYGLRLGKERALLTNPYRSLIDAGAVLAGGSDSNVTPMNPLLGIHAAVNRSNTMQRISVQEAVDMFTINGAYAVFKEEETGSVEVNKKADFVVLSADPFKVEPGCIKDIEVLMTIKGGKVVYEK